MALFAYHEKNVFGNSKIRIIDKRLLLGFDSLSIDTSLNYVVEYTGVTQSSGRMLTQGSPISPSCLLVSNYIESGYTVDYFVSGGICIIVSFEYNGTGGSGSGSGDGGGNPGPWWLWPCTDTSSNNPPSRMAIAEPCPGSTGWYPAPEQPNTQGYFNSRISHLAIYLDSLNFGMIECDTMNLFPLDPVTGFGTMYQSVAQHTPHDSVINRIDSLKNVFPNAPFDNYYLQSLEEAYGAVVNCDFFPVRIQQLPTGYTPASLIEYFRSHINDFISTGLGISFSPYTMGIPGFLWTDPRFNYSDTSSIGGLVHVAIPGNSGSVVVSGYNHTILSSGYQSHSFTVSTMQTPLDYEHPVAGNRRWGVYNDPYGGYTFYTMGVDRVWDWWTQAGSDAMDFFTGNSGFDMADELWTDVQQNMINFVNANGGQAFYYSRKNIIARPKWNDVKDYLMGIINFETLKQRLGC